jgi:hypothetical protein
MKKREFKKLALMGLTSGLLVNSSATEASGEAQESANPNQTFLAKGCGSSCGSPHQKGCGSSCGSPHQKGCGSSCGSPHQKGCGGSCGSLHAKCGGHGSCGSLNAKCGGHGSCGSIAEGDKPDSSTIPYASPSKYDNYKSVDPNDGNLGYHMMTEQELMLELNPEGVRMYKSLSPEGKALALQVASMRCNASNSCRGLNACKTDKNDCAGQGQCKGQGKCAIADKNLAVKLVYKKMQEKRSNALR